MRIYIAGKVSGEDIAQCTMKFGNAYQLIRLHGADAVNPLAVVNDWHITWQMAMKKCIKALMECDAVYALPCWKDSKGAQIELDLAQKLGIKIYYTRKSLENNLAPSA
ncbi:DUF4406 domain-containing protein [Zobellia galactanivorans]|uniref:DUF4406 domain-containing protein n=1 Tax=Zobellia galactanivorans (strain DSM 12802 / CCUG 47099 / CIP 106680 / NCIMB 13871 / Dsij) TaxID=63186 RepID=UPI0026E2C467|nr:DUF4406 domain-containing protein [Zobellia galactanivorans]MDO6808109.1 DUF4406 domain-containing protein [Zobellia galactanivorans]